MIQMDPLLKSTTNFKIAANKKGYSQNVKPGKYKLNKGLGNNEIINVLRSKRLTVKVVFNNQERLEDLAGRISQQIEADSLSLITAFKDAEFLSANGFTLDNAMSLYLPNSYDLFWDTTAETFREKMLSYYERFWNASRRAKAKALNLTPQEVYILASIVQKESPKRAEQPRLAGAYLNRLKRRIKLQADPTVIFAMKKTSGNFDLVIKRVLLKDLKIRSPYNTYRVNGLPPGPINNPGSQSIKAALYPADTNFLYFVAQGDGSHVFTTNQKDHLEAKRLYKKFKREKFLGLWL